MSGHTPGPWALSGGEWVVPLAHAKRKIGWSTDEAENRDQFADLITYLRATNKIPKEQMAANARLIAAAPELLEALTALLAKHDPSAMFLTDENCAARAAIAKATQP